MAKHYEWMFRSKGGTNLEALADLRQGVSELERLNASYRLQDVTDMHPNIYSDEMFWLMGSWEIPDRYSPSRVTRYVNPTYVHRKEYADVVERCACGALVGRECDRGGPERGQIHHDGCRSEWRILIWDKLRKERMEWLKKAAELYLSREDTAARMGISASDVDRLCEMYELDWTERWRDGRLKAVRTWRKLYDEFDYTWDTIADAFGVNAPTVRQYARGNAGGIDV